MTIDRELLFADLLALARRDLYLEWRELQGSVRSSALISAGSTMQQAGRGRPRSRPAAWLTAGAAGGYCATHGGTTQAVNLLPT